MIVGLHVTVPGTVLRAGRDGLPRAFTNGEHIGILVAAPDVRIYGFEFAHLRSSGGNGAAVVFERPAWRCHVEDCHVDGTDNLSESAAFVWHPGSAFCRARGCSVTNHPRSAFSIGSTTYAEFPAVLPWSYGHDLQDCLADHCGDDDPGDASSGFVIVGSSHDMRLKNNIARYCRGAGFAASGSLIGDGTAGTPMLTESPTNLTWDDNVANRNEEEGFRALGTNALKFRDNDLYENSQRGQGLFGHYRLEALGPGADLRDLVIDGNRCEGAMPRAA